MFSRAISIDWPKLGCYVTGTIIGADSLKNAYYSFREFSQALFSEPLKKTAKKANIHSQQSIFNLQTFIFGSDSLEKRKRHFFEGSRRLFIAVVECGISYLLFFHSSSSKPKPEPLPSPNKEEVELERINEQIIQPALKVSKVFKIGLCLKQHSHDLLAKHLLDQCSKQGYFNLPLSYSHESLVNPKTYACYRLGTLTEFSNAFFKQYSNHFNRQQLDASFQKPLNLATPPVDTIAHQDTPLIKENRKESPPSSEISKETPPPADRSIQKSLAQRHEEFIRYLIDNQPKPLTEAEKAKIQEDLLQKSLEISKGIDSLIEKGNQLIEHKKRLIQQYVDTQMKVYWGPLIINLDHLCDDNYFKEGSLWHFLGYTEEKYCQGYNNEKQALADFKKQVSELAYLYPTHSNTNCRDSLEELLHNNELIYQILPKQHAEYFIHLRAEFDKMQNKS